MVCKTSKILILLLVCSWAFAFPHNDPKNGLQVKCAEILAGVDGEMQVELDWDRLTDLGYISKLVRDPGFLQMNLDLTGGSPRMSLNQFREVLDLPIVAENIGPFVSEVLLAKSNIHFNVQAKTGEILEPVIVELARARETEIFKQQILPIAANDLQNHLWIATFESASNSPNIRTFAEQLAKATSVDVVHTTRTIAPDPEKGSNINFTTFGAGCFGVTATLSNGSRIFLVLETESKVGHLANVDPGETRVDGWVRIVQDAEGLYQQNNGVLLSPRDVGELLRSLTSEWGYPGQMAAQPSDGDTSNRAIVINALAAIYANGDPAKLTP